MDSEAHGAELPGEPDRTRRTGLTRRTPGGTGQPAGIKEAARSGAAPGELMRLFVAIAPPAAVLDELDALARPLQSTFARVAAGKAPAPLNASRKA